MSVLEDMDCVYMNPNAPIEARVKDLLSRMSLKEKIGQMTQIERSVANPSAIKDFGLGSVFSGPGNGPFESALSSDWADMVDGFQKSALESRLEMQIWLKELGLQRHLKLKQVEFTILLLPVLLDPRWGRCYESFGEGTDIVRKMSSIVSGLQGQCPEGHQHGYPFVAGRSNVIACAKHFVGDGGTEKGISEGNTVLSYDDLERIHMAPYLDCISQGVSTIMATYSCWNGRRVHSIHFLLTEILKEKLGLKGFVISDWEGLDQLCEPYGSDYSYCILTAINAAIDMVMVPLRYKLFVEELTSLVESGEVSMTRIDDAVERILRVKFAAGLFEFPLTDRSLLDLVGCKKHRDVARVAVRMSLVLLKNGKDQSKPFLPLNRKAKRILVAGIHADDLGCQCGGWTITKYGSSGRITIGMPLTSIPT